MATFVIVVQWSLTITYLARSGRKEKDTNMDTKSTPDNSNQWILESCSTKSDCSVDDTKLPASRPMSLNIDKINALTEFKMFDIATAEKEAANSPSIQDSKGFVFEKHSRLPFSPTDRILTPRTAMKNHYKNLSNQDLHAMAKEAN